MLAEFTDPRLVVSAGGWADGRGAQVQGGGKGRSCGPGDGTERGREGGRAGTTVRV